MLGRTTGKGLTDNHGRRLSLIVNRAQPSVWPLFNNLIFALVLCFGREVVMTITIHPTFKVSTQMPRQGRRSRQTDMVDGQIRYDSECPCGQQAVCIACACDSPRFSHRSELSLPGWPLSKSKNCSETTSARSPITDDDDDDDVGVPTGRQAGRQAGMHACRCSQSCLSRYNHQSPIFPALS